MRDGRGQAIAVAVVAPEDLAAAGTKAVAAKRENSGSRVRVPEREVSG